MLIENSSGLRPRGHAVLVRPSEDIQKKDSVIAIPTHVKERHLLLEDKVVVVEVGPMAWYDEKEPRAVPGDTVLISQFAGHMAIGPKDGLQYRIVNARDIFAVVEEN
jgi:co-chaperonin GroES (HSP10)